METKDFNVETGRSYTYQWASKGYVNLSAISELMFGLATYAAL
jgi:hypothetical protein